MAGTLLLRLCRKWRRTSVFIASLSISIFYSTVGGRHSGRPTARTQGCGAPYIVNLSNLTSRAAVCCKRLLLPSLLLLACATAPAAASDIITELRGFVTAGVQQDPELSRLLQREYSRRRYEPIWIGENELSPSGKQAYTLVSRAEQLGVLRDYSSNIKAEVGRYDYAGLARLDYQLSVSLVRLLTDISEGHIPAIVDDSNWAGLMNRLGTERRLSREMQTSFLDDLVKRESPARPEYTALLKELDRYNRIVASGGWPQLSDDGPTLKPGMIDEQVAVLRQRLRAEGFIFAANREFPQEYDDAMKFAVQRFQLNNGLNPDAIIGPNTRRILNVTAEQRRQQILVNLERLRWLPETLGGRYLWVNVPNYRLTIYDQAAENDSKVVLDMATIVGRPERPTPVFYDKIEYLEVNPYWNVPDSIAFKDYLPKIMADLSVLEKEHMKVRKNWRKDAEELDPYSIDWLALFPEYAVVEPVEGGLEKDIVDVDADTVEKPTKRRFPFHLRQEPGPHNSLGRVKFMFPNEHYVYLHDTPKQYLFKRGQRAFSSGCVRVSDPSRLAQFLMDTQQVRMDAELQMSLIPTEGQEVGSVADNRLQYETLLNTGKNMQVALAESLPVYLVYFTAWVDSQGRLQFRPDIYNRDTKVAEQLAAVENSVFTSSRMSWADTPKMFVDPKPEPQPEPEVAPELATDSGIEVAEKPQSGAAVSGDSQSDDEQPAGSAEQGDLSLDDESQPAKNNQLTPRAEQQTNAQPDAADTGAVDENTTAAEPASSDASDQSALTNATVW